MSKCNEQKLSMRPRTKWILFYYPLIHCFFTLLFFMMAFIGGIFSKDGDMRSPSLVRLVISSVGAKFLRLMMLPLPMLAHMVKWQWFHHPVWQWFSVYLTGVLYAALAYFFIRFIKHRWKYLDYMGKGGV